VLYCVPVKLGLSHVSGGCLLTSQGGEDNISS